MASKSSRSTDLTQGNILRLIIQFALPIFAGHVLQNLYQSVDAVVVGKFVSTTALAAVSSSSDISMLLTGFFTGLAGGSGVLFARHFGGKNYKELHDSIHTAVAFALILGTCMAAIGIIFTPQILWLVDCPADVYNEASMYLRVYLIGVLFTAVYNVGSGVLRAVGDSRSPFYYLVASSVTNIVLDLLFVALFKWGVMGVAVATVISQALSVTLVARQLMTTKEPHRLILKDLRIRKDILAEVVDLGIPAAIQMCLIAMSNLFVQRYINGFGSAAMAGIGAAKKIDKFAGLPAQSIGLATTTFVSQNMGAKKGHRAVKGIRTCLLMVLVCISAIGIPIFIFARFFASIFTDDPAALSYAVRMIHTIIPFYIFQGANAIFANAVRGFGKSRTVMFCSIFGMIGCRQLYLAITMKFWYSVTHVNISFPVGWFFAALFVMIYYFWYKHGHREELRDTGAN